MLALATSRLAASHCPLPTVHCPLTHQCSLPSDQRPLSVWELTSQIKDLLEAAFPAVWVAGEVSNFARPQSGHCYLTLKDDRAQLRAVMWRGVATRVRFDLHDGLEVICRGHLDVYAPRGSYQLVIEDIVPRGMGALELALRQLREKLAREGLFDPARKRPLPAFVRRIAVVTSPTGAAIRDFLQVLGRRWRGADVLVVPVRVQGEGAAAEIAAAIETVNRLPAKRGQCPTIWSVPAGTARRVLRTNGTCPLFRPDCLVVTRGGGSMEDLWAFNEEAVVRAIAASQIPGHLGRGPRDRRDAGRSGGRRAGADAQRSGRTGRPGRRGVGWPTCGRSSGVWRRACGRGPQASPVAVGCLGRQHGVFAARSSGFSTGPAVGRVERPSSTGDSRPGAGLPGSRPTRSAGRLESLSPLAVLGPGIQPDAAHLRWPADPRRRRAFARRADHHPIRPAARRSAASSKSSRSSDAGGRWQDILGVSLA